MENQVQRSFQEDGWVVSDPQVLAGLVGMIGDFSCLTPTKLSKEWEVYTADK